MKLKRYNKSISVPLFSTSDIAFLLLIFIMLLAIINYRAEVSIQFPLAENAPKVIAEKNLEIWVDLEGNLYLGGTLCDLDTVQKGITDAYRISANTRVHILADRDVPFMYVQQVLEVLQVLQYRTVSLVVKDP